MGSSPNLKSIEEWNDGTLEYWVKKKYFCFDSLHIIPSFQHSNIPWNYPFGF